MSFGDAAQVSGPRLRHPRGIRDLAEWYMSYVTRPEYIAEVFERQCEIVGEARHQSEPLSLLGAHHPRHPRQSRHT